MSNRKAIAVLAVAALGFAPAPLPKPDPSQVDLKKLQGTWVVVSDRYEGGAKSDPGLKAVVAGDRLTYIQDGKPMLPWVLTLDARQSPKTLDMRISGRADRGALCRAVYSLEGDTLKLSHNGNWKDRPKDMTGTAPGTYLRVFKRLKP
jgi:uncharacterized protein (TIGR03067 family)